MKLEIGRWYKTRNPKIENIGPAKIVSEEEFARIFKYHCPDSFKAGKTYIAVYGLKTRERPTYARLYENGRSDKTEENFYDVVSPLGNVLNE